MNTYENLKTVIFARTKTREQLLIYMDVFLMNDRIKAEQYNELFEMLPEA
ncbi:MAG: hypothetical protein E6600_06820 [Anaerocolumna aminovalerica]|nr:hypothetical protein [Anaerocolumna aminovalerica]MDU6264201.1 hypothetical protein [Anaerocolumna aminovalerica]